MRCPRNVRQPSRCCSSSLQDRGAVTTQNKCSAVDCWGSLRHGYPRPLNPSLPDNAALYYSPTPGWIRTGTKPAAQHPSGPFLKAWKLMSWWGLFFNGNDSSSSSIGLNTVWGSEAPTLNTVRMCIPPEVNTLVKCDTVWRQEGEDMPALYPGLPRRRRRRRVGEAALHNSSVRANAGGKLTRLF